MAENTPAGPHSSTRASIKASGTYSAHMHRQLTMQLKRVAPVPENTPCKMCIRDSQKGFLHPQG